MLVGLAFCAKCLEGTTERSDSNRVRSARIGEARTMCLEGTTPQDVYFIHRHRRTACQAEPFIKMHLWRRLCIARPNEFVGLCARLAQMFLLLLPAFMRSNAPWHCGLRAFSAWHFCAIGTKMPNVLIVAYVSPGRCLGLSATTGLFIMSAALGNSSKLDCSRLHDISARHNHN